MPNEEETYRKMVLDKLNAVADRTKWLEDHYTIFNEEFGYVKTDVRWLVRFFWIIASSSVGALIATMFNLFHK